MNLQSNNNNIIIPNIYVGYVYIYMRRPSLFIHFTILD